jgi:hypothetical protein
MRYARARFGGAIALPRDDAAGQAISHLARSPLPFGGPFPANAKPGHVPIDAVRHGVAHLAQHSVGAAAESIPIARVYPLAWIG